MRRMVILSVFNKIICGQLNQGQISYFYATGTVGVCGAIVSVIFSTPHNFNPPVRVRKPLNNRFRIQLYAKVAAQNMDTATSRILMDTEAQDYVLILNFKKCSCGK